MEPKQLALEESPKEQLKDSPKTESKPVSKAQPKASSKASSKVQSKDRLLRGALSTIQDLLQYLDLRISKMETDLEAFRGARRVLAEDAQIISSKRGGEESEQ